MNEHIFNPGSERNILSICMRNPDKLIEVEEHEIFAEHFSVPGHKYIYTAMMYLYKKDTKPSPLAVMEALSSDSAKKLVEEIGGLHYLILLLENTVPEDNLLFFINKVKQSSTRSKLIQLGMEVVEFAKSDKSEVLNPSELIAFAENKLADMSLNANQKEVVYKMGDKTDEVLNERIQKPGESAGLLVGFDEYDKLTRGGSPGDLIIVCAESKTGKSVLLTNWATNVSIKKDDPVLYVDTEMSGREQEDRILANLTGIPEYEIESGLYVLDTENGTADEKCAKLDDAKAKLKQSNYFHIYMPHFTIEKVSALARKFIMRYNIKALFFDYIKIPSNNSDFQTQKEYQKLGYFTSGLKDLAGILGIPVFSACQANRNDLGNENPDASDIGGSYRILQLASKLIFLTNKSERSIARDGELSGNQQLWIKYQRKGESNCDPINIHFNKPILRQTEV